MNRTIRIIVRQDSIDDEECFLSDGTSWGEQPPDFVPGEILVHDRDKVADLLRRARRQGKVFRRRASSLVALDAMVVGASAALWGAAGAPDFRPPWKRPVRIRRPLKRD